MSVAAAMQTLFGKNRIGLGCMGLSGLFGSVAPEAATAAIHLALESGIRHFDTAELYGPFLSEEILASALRGRQEDIVIATKVGYRYADNRRIGLDGRPQSLRYAVDGCLRRLKRECIDLLYLHREDPQVPIEDSIEALHGLVGEGKARAIGLSAVDTNAVARACRVAPIAAVQNEYSLLHRDVESDLRPSLEAACIVFVGYSPLARGLLSDGARNASSLSAADYRRSDRRFEPERFAQIQEELRSVKEIAADRGVSVEAVAIAWLLNQGVAAIPGCRTSAQVEAIIRAMQIKLGADELQKLHVLNTHAPVEQAR